MVAPDGSVYMEMVVSQSTSDTECSNEGDTYTSSASESISILKNGTQFQTVASSSGTDGFTPSDLIPDGNGGLLASYLDSANTTITVFDSSSGAQAVLSNIAQSSTPDRSMVLGDNNTGFITDGTNVAAIDATTLQQHWTYTSTGGTLSFINATSGGGVTISDSERGAIQLDSTGSANSAVANLMGGIPLDLFSWQMVAYGELTTAWNPNGSNGVISELPRSSPSPSLGGNPEGQNAPPFCQVNRCALAPVNDSIIPGDLAVTRQIKYGVYSLNDATLTAQYSIHNNRFKIVFHEDPIGSVSSDIKYCNALSSKNSGLDFCLNLETDDDLGFLLDEISVELSPPFELIQTFFVNRGQVRVFWPSRSNITSPWFGAWTQQVIATPKSVTIRQVGPDLQSPTVCQPTNNRAFGCDLTLP